MRQASTPFLVLVVVVGDTVGIPTLAKADIGWLATSIDLDVQRRVDQGSILILKLSSAFRPLLWGRFIADFLISMDVVRCHHALNILQCEPLMPQLVLAPVARLL